MIIAEEVQLRSDEIPQELLAKAREARENSYAPYSKYRVSAAIKTRDGRIFTGVNVENCAYPTSMCAERNALATAVGEGFREFEAVAIITPPDSDGNPGSPCGACTARTPWISIRVGRSDNSDGFKLSKTFPYGCR